MIITNLDTHLKHLNKAIRLIPKRPTRLLKDPNLFQEEGVRTTAIEIEYTEEKLVVIPETRRDDPPSVEAYGEESTVRYFPAHHFKVVTNITSADIQDIRQTGTIDLTKISSALTKQLVKHRLRHDLTAEFLMLGAIKGKIVDHKTGKTKIDLFKEFDIPEPITDIKFTDKSTDVGGIIEQFIRDMEDGLFGDTYTGITALCSPEFFDALIAHPSVKEAWKDYDKNVLARENTRGRFAHKGITFEVYRYNIGNKPLIEAGHAHVFFEGMQEGFVRKNAPATFIDKANEEGEPYYTFVAPDPDGFNRSIRVYSESNPLMLCLKPKTLMHLTMS